MTGCSDVPENILISLFISRFMGLSCTFGTGITIPHPTDRVHSPGAAVGLTEWGTAEHPDSQSGPRKGLRGPVGS